MSSYEKMSGGDIEMGDQQVNPLAAHVETGGTDGSVGAKADETYDAVVYLVVPVQNFEKYKAWMSDVMEAVSACKGFKTRYVHEVERSESHIQLMVVTVFDSYPSYSSWLTSDKRRELFDLLRDLGVTFSTLNACDGPGPSAGEGSKLHRILDQSTALKLPKPRPPPKWKLTLLLILSIYIIVVVYICSGQSAAMLEAGLPKGFTVFVFVTQLVLINVFAWSRIVTEIKWIDKWLRMERSDIEHMNPVHAALDQGLMIFASKSAQAIHPELAQWMVKMEGKMTKLRKVEFELKEAIEKLEETRGKHQHHVITDSPHVSKIDNAFSNIEGKSVFAYQNSELPKRISMAVRHFVKWEFVNEFEVWTDEIEKEMRCWPGFFGMVKISPLKDKDPYILSFSFDTAEHLLAFSKSDRRKELLLNLVPLLEATSIAEINEERTINDTFSELFVATGGAVKRRPPPLWKTCILTIVPLHFIVWQVGGALDLYLIPTGMSIFAIAFIKLAIHITINSYIGVPLMFFLFGDWLNLPRPVKGVSYIRFLEFGVLRPVRYAIVVVYTLSCLLGGLLS